MKYGKALLCILVSVSFLITLLLTCIDFFAFQRSFYKDQYEKLETAQEIGISSRDLNHATDVLLDYLEDKRDNISVLVSIDHKKQEMFNDKEVTHMVDVKNLYQGAMKVKMIMFLVMILGMSILYYRFRKHLLFNLSYYYVKCTIFTIVCIGVFGLWMISDFTMFWNSFHRVFFTNDLWLLNPVTDRMIQMFPEPFFYALVTKITIVFFVVFLVLFGLSLWYIQHALKQEKEKNLCVE